MKPLPKFPRLKNLPHLLRVSDFPDVTERLEYLLIAVLICTALFLLNRTCLPDGGIGAMLWSAADGISAEEISEDILTHGQPVALMFRTSEGRCGIQYDQERVSAAYAAGGESLLNSALGKAGRPEQIDRASLPEYMAAADRWAYYDFPADIPFSVSGGQQQARKFLLLQADTAETVLYFGNSRTGQWYRCSADGADEIAVPESFEPNGAFFAFEKPEEYGAFDILTMLLPNGPDCPVYTIANPLADADDTVWNSLAQSLGLNARTATLYEGADGLVMRDGSTTLRIQHDGMLTYRSGGADDSIFPAAPGEEQQYAEALLAGLLGGRSGQASLSCSRIDRAEDGSVRLLFYYYLNGVRLELKETGWAARVTVRANRITVLELCFRTCTAMDSVSVTLPVRQAAAAASGMGLSGQALELYYPETGLEQISAVWAIRTGGAPANG